MFEKKRRTTLETKDAFCCFRNIDDWLFPKSSLSPYSKTERIIKSRKCLVTNDQLENPRPSSKTGVRNYVDPFIDKGCSSPIILLGNV